MSIQSFIYGPMQTTAASPLRSPPPVMRLVERVGAGAPVREEEAEADRLEHASNGANSHSIQRALLGDDLRDELCEAEPHVSVNYSSKGPAAVEKRKASRTDGAELAMKIRAPMYAAPLYVKVPVALMSAATPYDCTAEPASELPHVAAAVAASLDLKNSSLESAAWARR